jgi:hypothetical protein
MQDKEGEEAAMRISGQIKMVTLQVRSPNSQEWTKRESYPARRCWNINSSFWYANPSVSKLPLLFLALARYHHGICYKS